MDQDLQQRMTEGLAKTDRQNELLRDGLKMLVDADQKANKIGERLHDQGTKLKSTSKNLDKVDENMVQSKKTLNAMNRSFWNPLYWFK